MAKVEQNAPPSIGSVGHYDSTCKPCLLLRSPIGCRSGAACIFCHDEHKGKNRPRPCKGKRARYRRLVQRIVAQDEVIPPSTRWESAPPVETIPMPTDFRRGPFANEAEGAVAVGGDLPGIVGKPIDSGRGGGGGGGAAAAPPHTGLRGTWPEEHLLPPYTAKMTEAQLSMAYQPPTPPGFHGGGGGGGGGVGDTYLSGMGLASGAEPMRVVLSF